LASIYQHSPLVLLSKISANINGPKDLIGKKVMHNSNIEIDTQIFSRLKKEDINLKDITIVPHTFKINALLNNEVDALQLTL